VIPDPDTELVQRPIFVRYVICIAVGCLALVVPQGENRGLLVALLLGSVPVQLGLMRIKKPRREELAFVVHDITLAIVAATVQPSLWPAAVIAVCGSALWCALVASPQVFAGVALMSAAALGLSAHVGDVSHWTIILMIWISIVGGHGSSMIAVQRVRQSLASRLGTVMQAAGVAIHDSDLSKGTSTSVSGPIEQMTGWTAEQFIGMDHRTLVHPDDLPKYWVDLDRAVDGEVFDRTGRFRRPDGTWAWIRDISRIATASDGSKTMKGLAIDVTDLQEALASAEYRSSFDQLTGLPNRFAFMRELDRRLANQSRFGLLMLDLDRFKEINDTLGHASGDELLVEFAARLRASGKATDCVSRLGGDEFAVLVDLADEFDLAACAQRILAGTQRSIVAGGVSIVASASIGGVLSSVDPIDRSTMLRWADIAMYNAKRAGNSFCMFSTELERTSIFDLLLTSAFSEALDAGEVIPHFQPKIDLIDGRLVGAELLARWQHPQHGLLGANQFTHLILVSEHLTRFTEVMFRHALAACRQLDALGLPIPLSVNVSARSLVDVNFPERLGELCAEYGVHPSRLILELTEDELMDTRSSTTEVIQALGEMGVGLSIDDFGAGYSSFSRLPNLNIDEIKIDRGFLWGLADEERNGLIISSIIGLGQLFDFTVVAEGVETVEQLKFLQSLGCGVGQGYLFGRPVGLEAFLDQIDAQSWASVVSRG
jgi:diguanylate cyclase (GGDEF)-like protein/PAS domain S-box-containing protein